MANSPSPVSSSTPRLSPSVARSTPHTQLPDWLSRNEVRSYLGISLSSADNLIHKLPHQKFGKHVRVAKQLLAPTATSAPDFASQCRQAIQQLLNDKKTPPATRKFILKELAKRGIAVVR